MPTTGTIERRKAENCAPLGDETSINWEDDESALAVTLKATTAQHGAVRVPLDVLRSINRFAGKNVVAWERQPLDGNPYHGNIVFLEGIQKPQQRLAASTLALAAKLIEKKPRG